MKIMAPINCPEQVPPLLEAGAKEFYCGVLDGILPAGTITVEEINREPRADSSLPDLATLARAVWAANAGGARVYVTFNALYYAPEQYQWLLESIGRVRDLGAEIIVADLGLMLLLAAQHPPIPFALSKVGGADNQEAVAFYRELGATRIIISEHWHLQEMARLVGSLGGLEAEVFVFNGGCKYNESRCHFLHGPPVASSGRLHGSGPDLGQLKAQIHHLVRILPSRIRTMIEDTAPFARFTPGVCTRGGRVRIQSGGRRPPTGIPPLFHSQYFRQANLCALCDLPAFRAMGITHLKIMGRGFSTQRKRRDVAMLAAALDLMEQGLGPEQFARKVRELYRKHQGIPCEGQCYYCR